MHRILRDIHFLERHVSTSHSFTVRDIASNLAFTFTLEPWRPTRRTLQAVFPNGFVPAVSLMISKLTSLRPYYRNLPLWNAQQETEASDHIALQVLQLLSQPHLRPSLSISSYSISLLATRLPLSHSASSIPRPFHNDLLHLPIPVLPLPVIDHFFAVLPAAFVAQYLQLFVQCSRFVS